MNIVCYNLRTGGAGRSHWREIVARYSPSVLLVQESSPPLEHLSPDSHGEAEENSVWAPAYNSKGTRPWGSAVYLPNYKPTPIELPSFNGWVVGAEVENWQASPAKSKKTCFFSLHAPSGMGSYQKVVNEILDCLLEFRIGAEIVIGGDFNLTVGERHESEVRKTSTADRKIQTRLKDEFGLLNCWQQSNPDEPLPQTLRWASNKVVPYHCDGIFVPKTWETALISCNVISGKLWDGLSDHNPVVARFS